MRGIKLQKQRAHNSALLGESALTSGMFVLMLIRDTCMVLVDREAGIREKSAERMKTCVSTAAPKYRR